MKYVRLLTYLGDHETPGLIRVMIPYLILGKYKNILATTDYTMTNSAVYYQGLNLLQVQRIATKDQLGVISVIKKNLAPKYGFKITYDIDDLITDIPEYNQTHDYYTENQDSIKKILETVDCIMCSTAELAKHLSKFNKTKVIQNRLFKPIWRMYNHKSFFETGGKPKIIYAGSSTHFHKDSEDDFDERITKYILETSKRFDWIFFGHRPKELENPNIIFHNWQPLYFDYPENLRQIDPDIGIALLQINDFNKCKSNLKALEYATLGIPCVYSNITPYQYTNCKVSNSDQFIERIEKLTSDQDYYEKIKNKDYNMIKDNLYWDDKYIKFYLDSYFKKKKKKK